MKRFTRTTLFLILLQFPITMLIAQSGGLETYKFLDLTNSARITGLGNNWIASKDGDINATIKNPSLITSSMHNKLSLDYVNYYGGINYGYALYGRSFEKIGNFTGSIQYVNYGSITEADYGGNITGSFNPSEYAINVGWGRELSPHFSIGAALKGIISQLHNEYNSWGLAADVAGTYYSEKNRLTVSLVANNIGYMVNPYTSGNNEPLPFGLSLGMSQRLQHVPIRYHFQYNNIEQWDLSYEDPESIEYDPISGEKEETSGAAKFGDNLLRHIVVGVEVMPFKFLDIYAGYNYMRRQEMKVNTRTAMVGFSWGLGINFNKFSIDFARATYGLEGSTNNITLSLDLQKMFKKTGALPSSNEN